MGHVGRHLAEVGQPVLARQFAVLDLQFIGQPAHFAPQRFVGLLQSIGADVPGIQHRLQVGIAARGDRQVSRLRSIVVCMGSHFVLAVAGDSGSVFAVVSTCWRRSVPGNRMRGRLTFRTQVKAASHGSGAS